MDIINISIDKLKPYKNNPRKNGEAVKYVAESIKEFGFKVPIVLDKNYEIIAGHTRYKASKQLGLKEVPCIIADDLNEEQIKAFRLADNKVAEKAEWDLDLLGDELNNIFDLDMSSFGFELSKDEEPEQEENEEELFDDIERQEHHYGVPYQRKQIENSRYYYKYFAKRKKTCRFIWWWWCNNTLCYAKW